MGERSKSGRWGEMGNGREIKEERVEESEQSRERVGRGTAPEPTRKLSESSRIQTGKGKNKQRERKKKEKKRKSERFTGERTKEKQSVVA